MTVTLTPLLRRTARTLTRRGLPLPLLLTGLAGAAGLDLQFTGGTAVPGGGACTLTLNSRCRFNNVISGLSSTSPLQRDVIVTVTRLNAATLVAAFDNEAPNLTTPPVPVATAAQFFAPTVQPTQTSANITGWAEFTFDVVTAGGAAPAVGGGTAALPGTFWVSTFDTDGDSGTLREFVEFLGVPAGDTGLATGVTSTLSAATAVDGGVLYQGSATVQPGIATANEHKASALYTNQASFKLVYGARTGANGSTSGGRLTAFDFYRPDAVLLRPVLDGFKSVVLTADADGSGTITPGDTLTYRVTYVNTGNAAVSGLQITDTLPTGVSVTSPGAQTVTINGAVTASAVNSTYTGSGAATQLLSGPQTIPANGTLSVSIPVRAQAVDTGTTVSNQASATATGLTAVLTDNVDTATPFLPAVTAAAGWPGVPAGSVVQAQTAGTSPTTVTIQPAADLLLTKSNGASSVNAGGTTVYTITLTNNGPSGANGTLLRDPAAAGLNKTAATCTASGGAVCPAVTATTLEAGVSVATLPAGGRITLTVTAAVTATGGSVSNSVTATLPSGTADPTPTGTVTDTDTVTPVADLSVSKTGPGFAKPGETLTYTLTLTNAGPSAASSVTLTDPLPAGLTYVSSSPAAAVSGQTLTWTLASLASGATQTMTVTATAPGPATLSSTPAARTLTNTATVSSSTSDPGSANNSGTAVTQLVNARLVKTVRNVTQNAASGTSGGGLPGEVLEYCVAFSNEGGVALPNFVLEDQVPASTTAQLDGYDAQEPSAATGFGMKLTRGAAVTYLTSAADATDKGTLSGAAGSFGRGTMTVTLGTLAVNEQGSACFRTTIR
ncbi:DUF11 domain-containing protein [Deinococcus taeanensis]|uniref:DUF11 domain-containing protein n=1 Tax=Deinococcus taeanensis TaxID=2737050 RepID=UPI001CDCB2E9|nr:DUF11 domain-containing protein [Deinococcus taeanensis]UBV42789.1 DUF11 domain-containing protein [Deinococcus taeanensis]